MAAPVQVEERFGTGATAMTPGLVGNVSVKPGLEIEAATGLGLISSKTSRAACPEKISVTAKDFARVTGSSTRSSAMFEAGPGWDV